MKLLFVGNYSRNDFLEPFDFKSKEIEYYFLDFNESKFQSDHKKHSKLGKVIFWNDFKNVKQLLSVLNPQKVVFLFLESFMEVLFNIACKEKGIPTCLIDHGVRVHNISRQINLDKKTRQKKANLDFVKVRNKILNEIFIYRSVNEFSFSNRKLYKKFKKIRAKNSEIKARKIIGNNDTLCPDYYLTHSNRNFDFYRELHQLSDFNESKKKLIGIPQFDDLYHFFTMIKSYSNFKTLLFIDQPFANIGLFGWTPDFKNQFITKLDSMLAENDMKLFVKEHPNEKLDLWKNRLRIQVIENIQKIDKNSFPSIVIGFYSTLLFPFIANPNITVYSLDIYPDKWESAPNVFLKDDGAVKFVTSLDGLFSLLSDSTILREQSVNKKAFVKKWMYKFDGLSKDRLKQFIFEG